MARRMQQPKEYYWQGKGGEGVTQGKIISELLGRDPSKYEYGPTVGDMTDVYTLQFDCYDDSSPIEGHSIIHVPHNENYEIIFKMILLRWDDDSTNFVTGIDQNVPMNNSLIPDIETYGFAIYLRKIASNQPYRYDYN